MQVGKQRKQTPVVCQLSKMDTKINQETVRCRSRNWETDEINMLAELVEENKAVIMSKHTNSITNTLKATVWASIADNVSSLGVEKRSIKDIKNKWSNLHQRAKREYCETKKYRTKTGGDPPPPPLDSATQKVATMFAACPSFNGIAGGFDSLVAPDARSRCTEPATVEATDADDSFVSAVEDPVEDSRDVEPESTATTGHQAPAPAAVVSLPFSNANNPRKKKRVTQEDVWELQCDALRGQVALQRQNLELGVLQKEKTQLQVRLLNRMLDSDEHVSASDLFLSMTS